MRTSIASLPKAREIKPEKTLASSSPNPACCSSVEQICWNSGGRHSEGRQMDNAHEHGGWTISEVERLTGLPRRDIQRCCYSGKGGIAL